MDPTSPRRPPVAQYGPPTSRSQYPSGGADPRYRSRQPQQRSQSPMMEPTDSTYGESAMEGAEVEQWPLPPRPVGQASPRSASPSGNGSRRPPPRQQQGGYYPQAGNQPRQPFGMGPPPNRQYHQGPPPRASHHGTGQWNGEGYGAPPIHFPQPQYARQPPPRSPKSSKHGFAQPQPGMHAQQRSQRPPPHSRVPAGYQHQPMPGNAFAEEAINNMQADSAAGQTFLLPADSENTTPGGVPSYYFEGSQAARAPASSVTSIEDRDSMAVEVGHERDDSRATSRTDPSPEPATLIRQASLGKKTKPMLTTVTSGERRKGSAMDGNSGQARPQPSQFSSREQLTPFEEEVGPLPGAWVSEAPTPDDHNIDEKGLSSGSDVALATAAGAMAMNDDREPVDDKEDNFRRSSHLLGPTPGIPDPTPSDTDSDMPKKSMDGKSRASTRTHETDRSFPFSPIISTAMPALDRERAVSPVLGDDLPVSPIEDDSERTDRRRNRPPTLDMDAVRDAEARGSMTSLPDLIRRATKVANNLDRGKTASKLGLNFFLNGSDTSVDREKYLATVNNRKSGNSFQDMLQPGSGDRRSMGNFSSMLRHSKLPSESDAAEIRPKNGKRCCGMPLWVSILLAVLLMLLIAAAVIIPVVLLVLPNQHHHSSSSSSSPTGSALQRCEQSLTCSNGGVNVVPSNGICSCLCSNGFTGKTCTTGSKAGCTTIPVSSTNHATIGDSIPDLILGAQEKYTIPLNKETLLGLFSSASMSCDSENALVNFNNAAKRSLPLFDDHTFDAIPTIRRRTTRTSTTSTSGSDAEFAGTAVLYIFQASGQLNNAQTAQKTLQSYFSSGQTSGGEEINPQNITLGNGFSCNLPQKSLVWMLSNGTVVSN